MSLHTIPSRRADLAAQLSPDERAHSERLLALIDAEIQRADGWLDFESFMNLALYAPGLGYYSAGNLAAVQSLPGAAMHAGAATPGCRQRAGTGCGFGCDGVGNVARVRAHELFAGDLLHSGNQRRSAYATAGLVTGTVAALDR